MTYSFNTKPHSLLKEIISKIFQIQYDLLIQLIFGLKCMYYDGGCPE